jgi:hypothetical protein
MLFLSICWVLEEHMWDCTHILVTSSLLRAIVLYKDDDICALRYIVQRGQKVTCCIWHWKNAYFAAKNYETMPSSHCLCPPSVI